jgi:hypothetical protein
MLDRQLLTELKTIHHKIFLPGMFRFFVSIAFVFALIVAVL